MHTDRYWFVTAVRTTIYVYSRLRFTRLVVFHVTQVIVTSSSFDRLYTLDPMYRFVHF